MIDCDIRLQQAFWLSEEDPWCRHARELALCGNATDIIRPYELVPRLAHDHEYRCCSPYYFVVSHPSMDSPVGVTVLAGLMAALFLVRSSTTVDEIQPADSVQGGQLPNKMPIASNAHHPPPEGYPRLSFHPCRAGACGGVRGRVCTEAEPGTFGEDHRPMSTPDVPSPHTPMFRNVCTGWYPTRRGPPPNAL